MQSKKRNSFILMLGIFPSISPPKNNTAETTDKRVFVYDVTYLYSLSIGMLKPKVHCIIHQDVTTRH